MQAERVYVMVTVEFDQCGQMYPRTLTWQDGMTYPIERVKCIRPTKADRAGGQGDRYTILVNHQERYLFFEHNADLGDWRVGRWFVERTRGTPVQGAPAR